MIKKKKAIILIFISILLLPVLWGETIEKRDTNLTQERYFGVFTGWSELFRDTSKEMVVSEDGSIYVVSPADHNVLVFNDSGILENRFGKHGQKDGELFYPASISILDDKYLVVVDYAFNCKFTLFDLQGNFKRVVKTEKPIYSLVPLTKNRVAYLYQERIYYRDKEEIDRKILIFIKNLKNGKEIEAESFLLRDSSVILAGKKENKKKYSIYAYYKGDVFIERSAKGELLVGLSSLPEIKKYSPSNGKLTGTIKLAIKPQKVEAEYKKRFRETQEKKIADRQYAVEFKVELLNKINSVEYFFDENLPYYKKILVDDRGKIIVILENSLFDDKSIHFQVYSPEGKFQYSSTLDLGEYELDMNSLRWFRKLYFTRDYVYALVTPKGEKNSLRLVKFKIKSNK
ncbi:MAG: hypothetical protein KAW12_04305 [Candidatus Aminicenantes bacterium]|nr:hypothetical protein [Candidatus Aminicenantes bacterium]